MDGVALEGASAESYSSSLSGADFLARASPGTNQNAFGLHTTRSRDRSAGPSLRLVAAGSRLGCDRASTKIGIIRDHP